MKNQTGGVLITKVIVILLILLLASATVCTGKQHGISEDATIIHKTYDGFAFQTQIEKLTVNNTAVVLTTSDTKGKFTKTYKKPFNKTAFKELTTLFEENKFLEMNESYAPQEGQPIISDAAVLEISLIEGNKIKTVKVNSYNSMYMPESLQKIDSKLLELKAYALSSPSKKLKG